MKKLIIGGAAALAFASLPAQAATFVFTPGGAVGVTYPGFTVIDTFVTAAGITGSGYVIKTGSSSTGAKLPPPSTGDSYLSVLGGGNALIALPAFAKSFAFDWGSLDRLNTLRVTFGDSSFVDYIPGGNVPSPATGNQFLPSTNGVFAVTASVGQTFKSIQLFAGKNSFEIDNLAVAAVPEPATWAMMLIGIGAIGAAMRRTRRNVTSSVAFA